MSKRETAPPTTLRTVRPGRTPISRYVFSPATRRRLPWLLALLALLALLPVAFLLFRHNSDEPQNLAGSVMVGHRLVPGPVCIEEAVDVSGSMVKYLVQRERAEHELISFAAREMNEQDRMSVAFFAATGEVALAPTTLRQISAPPGVPDLDPTETRLAPAVDKLVAARLAADPCAARALVVITDGILDDDQDTLRASIRAGNYTRMFFVMPSAAASGQVSQLDGEVLESITVYQFLDEPGSSQAKPPANAKPLDIIFGQIVGSLTGQRLARSG